MSENEEQVPLTRRERRLREQGETGALDLSEMAAAAAAPAVDPESSSVVDDIEISPVNADGTPRSRREIRVLREQALAARAAAREAEAAAAEETAAAEDSAAADATNETQPAAVGPAEPADADAAEAESVDEGETVDHADSATPELDEPVEDFDSLISPPTEPFTVEELRAAEAVSESQEPVADTAQVDAESDATDAAAPATAPKPRLKFWKRDKSAGAAAPEADDSETVETAGPEAEDSTAEAPAPEAEAPEAAAVAEDEVPAIEVPEPETAAADDTTAPVLEEAVADADADAAEAGTPASIDDAADEVEPEGYSVAEATEPQPKETYSFPDIAPPEEWRSVFDDPATRNVPTPAEEPQGDFDDLISRAVAQEGSTNGTSALILPAMPEDTGGLTGPLGATGELYVTGSMRLPKSLGETGGHVSLHDSTEIDPITGAETVDEHGTVAGPAPVSARHAVSARVVSGVPAVAKPAKERTKLPLVLGLTGGGLLVVVVGLGIWGASNGMFG